MNFAWLLGAGFWLGLPVTGMLLLRWARIDLHTLAPTPALRIGVLVVAGIIGWSPILLALALGGWFVPNALSVVGWLLFLAGIRPLWRWSRVAAGENRQESWALVTLLMLALLWSAAFPSEPILVGRDQGIYLNHALSIARSGSVVVASPLDAPGMASTNATLAPALPHGQWWLPGIFQTAHALVVQFPSQFTVWLAQAQGTLGIGALLRLNALFGTLAAGMFYLLLRGRVSTGIALAATVLFVANPAQQWIQRITLSEPLAQLALLTMTVLLAAAIAKGSSRLAAAAACTAGIAMMIRIDASLLVPLSIAAWALQRGIAPATGAEVAWRAYFRVMLVVLVPVGLYYIVAVRPYTLYNLGELAVVAVATVGAAVALLTSRHWGPALHQSLRARTWIVTLFGIALSSALLYAYLVRPHWAPFVLIAGPPDSPLLGMRDHREDSLVNLTAYLSAPVIALAALGVFLQFRRFCNAQSPAAADALPFVLFGGCIVAMLWRPGVAPDHFWAIRRFVPLAIPGVIYFAAVGFQWGIGHITEHRLRQMVACAAALLGIAFLLNGNIVLQGEREQRGMVEQIASMAAQLPDGLILSDDAPDLNVALWLGFGKPVVPLSIQTESQTAALHALRTQVSDQKQPVWLLTTTPFGHGSLASADLQTFRLQWSEIVPTVKPLPTRWQSLQRDYYLLRQTDSSPTDSPALWGGERHWQAPESGFYGHEVSGNGVGRWTNGAATLAIPLSATEPPPTALSLRVAVGRPQGSKVRVEVNGAVLFEGLAPAGVSTITAPLPVPLGPIDRLNLHLVSDTFLPYDIAPSADRRKLGIHLLGVALERPAPNMAPPADQSLAARIDAVGIAPSQMRSGSQPSPTVIRVANIGTALWNPRPAAKEPAIALGIVWRRPNEGNTVVAERRTVLPTTIRPGHYVTLIADLQPVGSTGKPLTPGNYQVTIDMVAEHQAWFGAIGGKALTFDVQVTP